MKQQVLQSALREWHGIFTSPARLLAMGLAIALLAISGPFGTLDYDPPVRLLYWLVVVVATYALGQVTGVLTGEFLSPRIRALPLRAILVAMASSVPASLVVMIATALAEPDQRPNFALLWFYVFAVSLALVAMTVVLGRSKVENAFREPGDERPDLSPLQDQLPALLERLERPMRGRLICLEVCDHYVDVTTDKGTSLVLIRLSDAIKETSPVEGMQVHRSHWVALDAVRKSVRENGRLLLEMETGKRVPVSRSYLEAVKAAGLVK